MTARQVPQERVDAYFAESRRIIAEHGYLVQTVFPTEESEHPYWFAYTAGLWPLHPELMLRGVGGDGETIHSVLTYIVDACCWGLGLRSLEPVGGPDHPAGVGRMRAHRYRGPRADWGVANRVHYPMTYQRLHVFLSDDHHRLPGDDGVDPLYEEAQGWHQYGYGR